MKILVMASVRLVFLIIYTLSQAITYVLGSEETNKVEDMEDAFLEVPGLLKKYGYPVEVHEVKTKDGYLLTMHRIPNNTSDKAPVFLQHGLLCSSIDYVIIGPGKALAYILADAGYDVWMGNARGNIYSRKHSSIEPDQRKFWQFSWHEIGVYDLPAMIDHILQATSKKFDSVYYIGHSQGTTSFYVMTSMLPEYNKKIRLMVNLSPVVFMSNLKNPVIRLLSPLISPLKDMIELVGGFEYLPKSNFTGLISREMCKDGAMTQIICNNFMFLFFGFDSDQLNATALPVIMSHIPAGASCNQLLHYGQLVNSGFFRQYDHGMKNIITYGQRDPPDYNLKKVTAPVALMYSGNDRLSDMKDVKKLIGILPNVVLKYEVPHKKFNHLDYLYAKDVNKLVYSKVLEIIKQN